MRLPLAASLLIASSVGAGMVDTVPAADPVSSIIDSAGARVVASDTGMYLAGAQRITADGVLVDEEPIPGVDGPAAAWGNGWLVASRRGNDLYVRHLGATGAPEVVMVVPDVTERLGIASASGRLAILDVGPYPEYPLRLTLTDGREMLRREVLGMGARGAGITRMGDGFLVAWWTRNELNQGVFAAMRLDANGTQLKYRVLQTRHDIPPMPLLMAASDRHAMLLWDDWSASRYRIVDLELQPTLTRVFHSGGSSFRWAGALPGSDGFLISYSRGRDNDRVRVIRLDGLADGDGPADPIAGADRSGNRYFVVRPWGHAAIAEGDPRAIVSAPVQLGRRVFERWDHLRSIVSGDVTLLQFGNVAAIDRFVRVDADGLVIDPEPRRIPAPFTWDLVTVPIPDGFAFAWPEGGKIQYQRLTRRGDWLDPRPVTIAAFPQQRRPFAIHANENDLLLAWAAREGIFVMRLTHAGVSIDVAPRRLTHDIGDRWGISIAGNGSDRLLALLDHHICVITCAPEEPRPFMFQILTIDRDASPLGALTRTGLEGRRAVGLPDGSWAIVASASVLHVARDGRLIAKVPMPLLSSYELGDVAPTPSGWKAIVPWPGRLVEFEGATTVSRLTGLTNPGWFAAGGRIAYLDSSPKLETVAVPWTGRIATIDGDVSVTTTDAGTAGAYRRVLVTVRNKGPSDVTNLRIYRLRDAGQSVTILLPLLRRGEAHQFMGEVPFNNSAWPVLALSSDVTDTDPSDNLSIDAGPRGERQRPVRP